MYAILPLIEPINTLHTLLRESLVHLQSATGMPWAWAIIVLTCLVRIAILPLTAKQTHSMLAMQRLQPHIKQINERYKDDKALAQQKLLEFYRDNKVNPLASCLPLLVQLPIFIGLLYALKGYHPSTGSLSFLFGMVPDITVPVNKGGAGGWILLVTYVLAQMASTKVMSASMPPNQRVMMYLLPVGFAVLLVGFSAGVIIYWLVSTLWTIGQYLAVVRMAQRRPAPEIVLPADSSGKKKTVMPKADKARNERLGAGEGDSPANGSTTGREGGPQAPAGARRNKRRR